MSTWSLTYQQSVSKRYHSDKHFSELLPTRWRQKSTGIDMEQNYVTVTLSIIRFNFDWNILSVAFYASAHAQREVSGLQNARSQKILFFVKACAKEVPPRGRRDDMTPPMTVRSKNRRGSTSVRGWIRSPHISGGRRWLSSRQLRGGTDRRMDSSTTDFTSFHKFDKSLNNDYLLLYCKLNFI